MSVIKNFLYAIKDVKVGFWKPFIQPNEAVAIRDFANMVNSGRDSFIDDNYNDLELWQIGTYDDSTGAIESDVKFIVSGSGLRKVVIDNA